MFISFNSFALEFAIVKTGHSDSFDFLSRAGGNFKKRTFNHSAFLIKHKDKLIAFDTAIGSQIEQEYAKAMPFWTKLFFSFEYTKGLKFFIEGTTIDKIYLSHVHWDHAGGLTDNLGPPPIIAPEELKELKDKYFISHATLRAHFKDHKPTSFEWKNEPFLNFKKHYDPFGDGKIIFVHLPGHSFGSMGMILNGDKDKYFFVGDAIWVEKQLEKPDHKFYLSSCIVDRNREQTMESIKKIKTMRDKHGFTIIPTHDSERQDPLGYFPQWIPVF